MAARARISAALAPAAVVTVAIALAASGPAPPAPGASPALALTSAGGKARIANSREGEAVIGAYGWMPGQTVKGHVSVSNNGPGTTLIKLSAKRFRDAGGDGGGVLSRATTVRVFRDRAVIDDRVRVFRGPLKKLRRIAVGEWRAGGTRTFRIWAELTPRSPQSDNSYQAAELSFDLIWSAIPE